MPLSSLKLINWKDFLPPLPEIPTSQKIFQALTRSAVEPEQKLTKEGPEADQSASWRNRGLFFELLHARPEHLLQDAQTNGKAYDENDLALLQQIYENRDRIAQLTKEETERLNKATAEFYSAKPGPVQPPAVLSPTNFEAPAEERLFADPPGASGAADSDWSTAFSWLA